MKTIYCEKLRIRIDKVEAEDILVQAFLSLQKNKNL
jgi:hypothetical protein